MIVLNNEEMRMLTGSGGADQGNPPAPKEPPPED